MVTLRITNFIKKSQTCEITVDKTTTIGEVKRQVAEKFNIDARKIRLIIYGRELRDELTLDDHGLYENTTFDVNMIVKLTNPNNTYKNKYNKVMNNLVNKTRSNKNRLNRQNSKQRGGVMLTNLDFVLFTGDKIKLEIDDGATIEDAKRALIAELNSLGKNKFGFTTDTIRLQLHRGPLLEIGTLKDNNVGHEARIHVIPRWKGPARNNTPAEPKGPNFLATRQTARGWNKNKAF